MYLQFTILSTLRRYYKVFTIGIFFKTLSEGELHDLLERNVNDVSDSFSIE